jgi:putative MFS transporter
LLLFSTVNVIPFGWRSFYLVGLLPLVWVAWMRRTLPETQRFETTQIEPERSTIWRRAIEPVIGLVTQYPIRFLGLFAVAFVLSFSGYASSFFQPKYLQDAHGWAPWQYSLLAFTGGFIALFGSSWSGRLSDRHGRRVAVATFLTLETVFTIAFYQASGTWLPPIWVMMVFSSIAGGVALTTFATELFPTSHRSTASGSRHVAATLGGVLGLYMESVLYGQFGSHWTAISLLAVAALVIPLVVYAAFPETSGRPLEEISPDRSRTVSPS